MVASRALPMGTVLAGFTLVRPLDAARVPTYAARAKRDDGAIELAAIERLPLEDDPHAIELARAGKRLLSLSHPNVARTKALELTDTELLFVSEFVDGERYDVVMNAAIEAKRAMSLVLHLRVLVDILSGLSALHLLRDTQGDLRLMHGEVCPAYVLLAMDGNAKIGHVIRPRGEPSASASGYAAPEVRLGDAAADHRADVYSCGVLLWEALAGRRLFKESSGILPRQLSDKLEMPPVPPEHPWAAPLVEVAARALAADPQARHPSTAELAADIRKIAGAKLALKSALGSLVKEVSGERIAERRRELAGGSLSTSVKKATPARPMPPAALERALVGGIPRLRDSLPDDEETRQLHPEVDDDDLHARKTRIPGDEYEDVRPSRLPAGLSHGVRPKVAEVPSTAIVSPPKADEHFGEEMTTRKAPAATIPSLPTRPFAFTPPAAAVRSSPPPPAPAPAARAPLPKPLAPPMPAAARLGTPKPMPSPLPPKAAPERARPATPAPPDAAVARPARESPAPPEARVAQPEFPAPPEARAARPESPAPPETRAAQPETRGAHPEARAAQPEARGAQPEPRAPQPEGAARAADVAAARTAADAREDEGAPPSPRRRGAVVFRQSSRPPPPADGARLATPAPSPVAYPVASSEPAEAGDFAPLPPRKNMRAIVLGVVGFAALLLVIAAVRAAMRGPDDAVPTVPSAAAAPPATSAAPAGLPAPTTEPTAVTHTTTTSTPPPVPRPTARPAAPPAQTAAPPATAAASPATTATGADPAGSAGAPDHDRPGSRPKVTPRPKGTYDPLGI